MTMPVAFVHVKIVILLNVILIEIVNTLNTIYVEITKPVAYSSNATFIDIQIDIDEILFGILM